MGDSFVAGVGDPECLGWAGRLARDTHRTGWAPTVYNLGVRRQTSREIAARWEAECEQRLPAGCDARVVLSFGANDATRDGAGTRVRPPDSVAALEAMLTAGARRGWQVLVVSPPPVADAAHTRRIAALGARFAEVCALAGVVYLDAHARLAASPQWNAEVAAGDGAHPGAAGYALFAELLLPGWREWLSTPR